MVDIQTLPPASQLHVEIIDGSTYEVISNYIGELPFLDLLKQMLKRDLERPEE